MTARKDVKKHLSRVGNSIPGAAKKIGVGEGTLRRAIDRKQVEVIEFGGLRRITDAEVDRVRTLFGFASPSVEEA
jgi:excisionase family DNA binding protein